jgi:hypothetical protein
MKFLVEDLKGKEVERFWLWIRSIAQQIVIVYVFTSDCNNGKYS